MIICPMEKLKNILLKHFQMNLKKEALSKMIYAQLSGDKSADNIRKTVSQMGMICEVKKRFANIQDILKLRLLVLARGSGRAKRIYHIVLSPKRGWIL